MTDEEKVTEKKNKVQPEENIERLKKIRQKRTSGVSMKYMAGAGAAVAVVIVVAVAGGVLGKSGESRAGRIKVETVEASLETTAPPETSGEPASIVLETTLSAEEIAEKEHDEAVQKVLDGYANLGIAGVSGYLNVRKIPETYGEVVGKLLSGGACEIIDTSTDGWYKISSGGVTGKMISPQSISVATAATGMIGQEGNLFRFALGHSIAMTLFICVLTYLQATVWQWMLP